MQSSRRNLGRVFFYPQVKFFRHQNSTEFTNSNMRTTITFRSDLIILPELNAGFNVLNQENLRFHLSAGAGVMNIINNRHIRNRYTDASSTPYFTTENKLTKATYTFNATGGLMVNKRFLVMATYHFPSPAGALGYYSVSSSGLQFRVGYKFNKVRKG
jgi:hypothetical protein